MTCRAEPPRRSTGRSGLTLVETLAAVALLASIAAACASLLRTDSESSGHEQCVGEPGSPALAELAIDRLITHPGSFGLARLADLTPAPRVLVIEPAVAREFESSLQPSDRRREVSASRVRAWRVQSQRPTVNAQRAARPADDPLRARGGPAACWLFVEAEGRIASRCVLIPAEAHP